MSILSKKKCARYRKRILDISQSVSALHIGGAFSCVEILEVIFNKFLNKKKLYKNFVLSKGHASILHYVILEDLGLIKKKDLNDYCKPWGKLGVHPNIKINGINVATGSLGHGLAIACGMAYAAPNENFFVVISDGELQEGSTWEAIITISSLKLKNLILVIDNNDLQSSENMSETHPNIYPIDKKIKHFNWQTKVINGHKTSEIFDSIKNKDKKKPLAIIAKTIKGYPISFMSGNPIWHYRSPNKNEYTKAIKELKNER